MCYTKRELRMKKKEKRKEEFQQGKKKIWKSFDALSLFFPTLARLSDVRFKFSKKFPFLLVASVPIQWEQWRASRNQLISLRCCRAWRISIHPRIQRWIRMFGGKVFVVWRCENIFLMKFHMRPKIFDNELQTDSDIRPHNQQCTAIVWLEKDDIFHWPHKTWKL